MCIIIIDIVETGIDIYFIVIIVYNFTIFAKSPCKFVTFSCGKFCLFRLAHRALIGIFSRGLTCSRVRYQDRIVMFNKRNRIGYRLPAIKTCEFFFTKSGAGRLYCNLTLSVRMCTFTSSERKQGGSTHKRCDNTRNYFFNTTRMFFHIFSPFVYFSGIISNRYRSF